MRITNKKSHGAGGHREVHTFAAEMNIETALHECRLKVYGNAPGLKGRGQFRRFAAPGKSSDNRAGWAKVLSTTAAIFGTWTENDQHVVLLDDNEYNTPEERRRRIEQTRQEAECIRRAAAIELKRKQLHVARLARHEWASAAPADPENPYLQAKGIRPYGLRQTGTCLIVPMTDSRAIVSVQSIHPDGRKRFMAGARKKACYYGVGVFDDTGPLYLCEGVATAHTIHEQSSGHPVATVMDCGNLLPVARLLREKYSDAGIIIAADNDRHTEGNPGLTAGRAAADAIGASLTWPRFPCSDCRCSDFNDLTACETGRADR